MADTTISSLPLSTPSGNLVLPISDGNNTYRAPLSDIQVNYNSLTNKPTIPTKTSDLVNDSGFVGSNSNLLPRAWFLSYGTTIQSQFNVSSITYNGASGTAAYYYTLTFTNPMPNTNYTFVGTVGRSSSRVGAVGAVSISYTDNGQPPYTNYPSLKTTTQLQISTNLSSPFIHGVIYG